MPTPKPKKRKGGAIQQKLFVEHDLTSGGQQYDPTPIINKLRQVVDEWRAISNPNDWKVTQETARLLKHWRQHNFSGIRPFFARWKL